MGEQILKLNGLSLELLEKLSYESQLGISLKKNLHYFDKEQLIDELIKVTEFLDRQTILIDMAMDSRIKSIESIILKYNRYYPNAQARKVFNDILGFRAFCDDYQQVMDFDAANFRIADMSAGKSPDDGYRGVHIYYQKSNRHYPIEIQFNTLYDRQINNWLHEYLYKKDYSQEIGQMLRKRYEEGKIRNEQEFKENLKDVLSNS